VDAPGGTSPGRRFVVYGAGAIGGVIGARLFQRGYDVALVARGPHYEALSARGLRLEAPDEEVVLPIPVADGPAAVEWRPDDVVLLTMKSHDTSDALRALVAAEVGAHLPVVCVQNGVENERAALRWFSNVYGVCVMCPTSHLEPGVVQACSSPVTGILDIGRYPAGTDDVAAAVADALSAATFSAQARPDILRWKYAKLLLNLANAVEAVCGPAARGGEIARMARAEGEACLHAAGIDFASEEEDIERRGDLVRLLPVGGQRRAGGSSWQSLQRGTGTIETDYLNGEVVLLGRLHDVATPVNGLLTRLARQAARDRRPPGTVTPEQFMAELGPLAS
jgi:2-dehydropantoate 2-reductase